MRKILVTHPSMPFSEMIPVTNKNIGKSFIKHESKYRPHIGKKEKAKWLKKNR